MLNAMREKMALIMWITLIAFFGTIVFSWGMGGVRMSDPRAEGVIAKINGNKVKFSQYQNIEERMIQQYGDREVNELMMAEIKENAWKELLKQELIQQAIEKNNIRVSDEEVYNEIRNNPDPQTKQNPQFMENGKFSLKKYQEFIDNPPAQMAAQFARIESYYKDYYLKQKNFQKLLSSAAFVTDQELKEDYIKNNVTLDLKYLKVPKTEFKVADSLITDAEVSKYYNENKSEFGVNPAQRTFDYVLFSTERTKNDTLLALQDLKYAIKEIENGKSFAEVAQMYSEGPSASKGGDLGYFGKGKMELPFEVVAFNAEINKLSNPVKTRHGYHVILVEDKKRDDKGNVTEVKARHILIKWKTYPETIDLAKTRLNEFREVLRKEDYTRKGFEKAAKQLGVKIETSETIKENRASYVQGLGRMPGLENFLFKNDVNTVSTVLNCTKGYVFAVVKEVIKETPKTLDDVKKQIISKLADQKSIEKSFEALSSMQSTLKDTTDFNRLAEKDDRFKAGFVTKAKKSGYISGIGRDEDLINKIFESKTNELVGPLKGTGGSFMAFVTSKTDFDEKKFNSAKDGLREKLLTTKSNQIFSDWLEKQMEVAEVEDYRRLYYK